MRKEGRLIKKDKHIDGSRNKPTTFLFDINICLVICNIRFYSCMVHDCDDTCVNQLKSKSPSRTCSRTLHIYTHGKQQKRKSATNVNLVQTDIYQI